MEQSLSSLTYKGSIPAAIVEAKKQRKLFVVYISGVNAESSRLDSSTWSDSKVAESVLKYCILLHLSEGSNDATQFSAIYPQKSIPCITAVGYNGVQLWQNEGFISAEVLASSLEKVWLSLHIQDTTAAVLSAALASKTSEPSSSGVSTTASSDQGSSDVGGQSPLTDRYGKSPDAITEVSPDKVKEHKSDACTAEEKSFECGVKTSSTSVDANEAGCASTDFSIEATKELPRSTVVDLDNVALLDGPHSPEKNSTDSNLVVSGGGSKTMNTEVNQVERGANNEDEADKRVNRVNKSNDVYLNIRMPDGVNLQEKFSVTSTLRMVKDYIDEHHEGVIGSYDLAIPYPRNVYSDQDLSRTLSELGLFDRQALIVVPRQRTTDQSNSRNIADSSNESNEGYFARLKRLFSFINPLSYLGGDGSSSTSSGQQSQHGPNSTLQNNFTQEQRPQNISSSSGNDGKNRRPTASHFGSNIHTLKHDEDDGRFNDRNSFWNGNSTQYGGNDDGK
ncbi:plant UBX domain-containing protein 11 [Morus notabilis]|uniref:plant UBX domain-containing protein 11 n=1 Tax=Morus notabilis TaxID=981085 RepID=UPI000CED1BE6|nr:plant UBX domain-containing protein 11 [Morus notabilis]